MTYSPPFSTTQRCKTKTLYYPTADQKHLENLFPPPMTMIEFFVAHKSANGQKRTIASSVKEYMINAGGNIKLPPVSL